MKLAERILVVLFMVGIALRLSHIPGSIILNTLVGLSLAVDYFLCGLFLFNSLPLNQAFKKSSYAGIGTWQVVMSILAGITMSQCVAALLFVVNDWPRHAAKLICVAAFSWLLPCIGLSVILAINKSHPTYKAILWRLIPAAVLLALLAVYKLK